MLQNLKALFWVLLAALPAFALLKPLMVSTMSVETFIRRRNLWLITTVLAFLMPDFWTFSAGYLLLLTVARKKEHNPVALLLLLMYAVPIRQIPLPSIGPIALVSVDNIVVLSLMLLLPALLTRSSKTGLRPIAHDARSIYLAMLVFCTIQIIFWMPVETLTHTLRRTVTLLMSTVLLYVGVAKLLETERMIKDALSCFVLGSAMMAAAAIPEVLLSWQLHVEVGQRWSFIQNAGALYRGGSLRALVTTDTPISLGHLLVCAGVAVWTLRDSMPKAAPHKQALLVTGLLATGVYLAGSRAPWLTAVVALIVYVTITPGGAKRLPSLFGITILTTALISMTPIGQRVKDFLPFIGTVDQGAVDYRFNLQQALWSLMWASPWTGNLNIVAELENFRQGQGIVDLLNVYAVFGASLGLPGLLSFSICFCFALYRLWRCRSTATQHRSISLQVMTAGLFAMIAGHMVLLTTMSYVTSTATLTWILLGMASARGLTWHPQTARDIPQPTPTAVAP